MTWGNTLEWEKETKSFFFCPKYSRTLVMVIVDRLKRWSLQLYTGMYNLFSESANVVNVERKFML